MILNIVKSLRNGAAVLALVTTACAAPANGEKPLVVVSTTMLGDLVTAVAGSDATVEVLMPVGVDPHDFQPSAQQIEQVATADLVVINGLGLEENLEDAIDASGTRVLAVAEMVDPLPWPDSTGAADGEEHHGAFDPHVWLDPVRMAAATRLVAVALVEIDPGGNYDERGETYAATLLAAHAQIEQILAPLEPGERLLVTNHEAFGYFAARYGFTVVGVVVPGGSTLAEPSSAELAALVATIRELGVNAIFAETTQPTLLAEAIATEAGSEVAVVELYSESLGEPGSEADTLAGMLIEDAHRIAVALAG